MFITFEGIDGSGKTTQIRAAAEWLRQQGRQVVLTREPGGTAIGDEIRQVLLAHRPADLKMSARAELLLFCASRAQLVDELIRPTVEAGGIVLCDRYADSTLAYQGYGHGLEIDLLRTILGFATGGLVPSLTVYLDLDPAEGLKRRQRGRLLMAEDWNRLDAMELAFHQRVQTGYERLIAEAPARWVRVSAVGDIDSVQTQVRRRLAEALQLPDGGTA